jgi:hypothetical protein
MSSHRAEEVEEDSGRRGDAHGSMANPTSSPAAPTSSTAASGVHHDNGTPASSRVSTKPGDRLSIRTAATISPAASNTVPTT